MLIDYIIALILLGSLLLFMLVGIIVTFIVIQRKIINDYQLELNEREHRYQRELWRTAMEVREQALHWASMEMHDNVGQMLSIIRMKLIHGLTTQDERKLKEQVRESTANLDTCMKLVRNISHSLDGKTLEKVGLVGAIEQEMNYLRTLCKIDCVLNCEGEIPSLTLEQNLLLFRIIQEGLNNIIKYAEATEVVVAISQHKGTLLLSVEDNGKGMDTGRIGKEEGMGLSNMIERTKMLNGEWSLTSSPGRGTKITVLLKNIHP